MTHTNIFRNNCSDPKLSFYDSAVLINANDWNKIVDKDNLYLSLPYLTALESAIQGAIEFRYIIFYDNLFRPVAVACMQLVHYSEKGLKYKEILCRLGDKIKSKLLESIDMKVLVCGNIFACGENGFAYTTDIEPTEAFKLLAGGMKRLSQEKEKNGQVSFALIKEFWPESVELSDSLKENSYKPFNIDVNMVMKIQPSWTTMDDYLASMSTKFRTKAKGVYKKSESIIVQNFEVNNIIQYKARIEELYHSVLSNAEYNFGELNGQAFVNFKENLKDQFIFKAYFIGEKMIGFSSVFYFDNIIDANYVGIDYEYNKDYAVYQRMLYDFVELSLKLGVNELRLGRTAELIKSSIGAEPVHMQLYVRHRNSISNKLLAPFISSIEPAKFELRLPFKKEEA
jgi:hypothetical protein